MWLEYAIYPSVVRGKRTDYNCALLVRDCIYRQIITNLYLQDRAGADEPSAPNAGSIIGVL